MAPRQPYRGHLPTISRTVGGSSREIDSANQNRTLEDIQREMLRGQDHSDLGPRNESFSGNVNEQTVLVKFKKPNIPVFVGHDLGYTIRNWHLTDKCGTGDVYRPKGKKYLPTKYGIWLACTVADCECRVRVDGQEGQK